MAKRNPYRTNTGVHIEWFTVKRSTIYTLSLALVGLASAGGYGYYQVFVDKAEPTETTTPAESDNSARFLDLDGSVKVRKPS